MHPGGAALGTLVEVADEQTEWVDSLWRQIDTLRAEGTAKSRKIEEQAARIEQLERELKAERQKQFKAATKIEEEPAPSGPEKAAPKKRGAPMGHPGWFRPTPTHFDRITFVPAPKRCPHCGAVVRVRPDLPPDDHPQEDFIDGQPMFPGLWPLTSTYYPPPLPTVQSPIPCQKWSVVRNSSH